MSWTSQQIRQTFLEFFKEKQHKIVDSAPLVIKDDPTLMFTNAGMNQFKPIFLGVADAPSPRIANTQKCLRVSGKHNDLEEVGKDHYHHTMFEMLGNWSFGDYFKQEAIDWAWELLTEVYKLDKSRLYVTVFEGDDELGVAKDEEAAKLWLKHVEESRILYSGRKDNFWEMGETGPCGPCSEVHVDLRSDEDRANHDGSELVNKDHPEVIEIWNLVFIQFNKSEDGKLSTLKNQHIDTGMGLERLTRVLQESQSNYDTDLFVPLIKKIETISGLSYKGSDANEDIAFRVIADHVRAISFSIADGQLPSNTGSGYVIRRILRRAIRYGFSYLNQKEPFIHQVASELINQLGGFFTELKRNEEIITKVIEEEERAFLQTLEKGLSRIDQFIQSSKGKQIPGTFAFELYDTFGFPLDLTRLIADENGLELDENGFEAELKKQKDRSRAASKAELGDWVVLSEGESQFIGYDELESSSEILKYRKVKQKGKEAYQVVLRQTPFYPEGGGQVGDKGLLIQGENKVAVFDTKKENDEIIHFIPEFDLNPEHPVTAKVDAHKRENTQKNHTATHLLHHALRNVLGKHVEQKGSLVAPDRLRFDFSHFEKVNDEELTEIERQVKEMLSSNLKLEEHRKMPISQAKEMGAMALFGEKYGDEVRVIKFGNSVELCGGTHVNHTNELDGFRITTETSVASGIRRVEAITGEAYLDYLSESVSKFDQIKELLGNPKDEVAAVEKLIQEHKKLQKELERAADKEKSGVLDKLTDMLKSDDSHRVVTRMDGLDSKMLKDAAYGAVSKFEDAWLIVVGESDDKPFIISAISKALSEQANLDAGKQVREMAKSIDGGGGGQKFLAMAGGKKKQGLEEALVIAKEIQRIQAS